MAEELKIEKIIESKWFLLAVVLVVILFIGSQTNWFGLAKPKTGRIGQRVANAYSDLTPEQRLELDRFRTELMNA